MVDLDQQKETLKILFERDYIKCVELNLKMKIPIWNIIVIMKTDYKMI